MDFLRQLFGSGDFRPHGYCYLWNSGLVWLHLLSDSLIALAYFTIPVTLVWFVRKRRDLPFSWMFVMFGVFIVACGTTHVMEIWNLWYANYWLAGAIKAVTAVASVGTAILLAPLVPKARELPNLEQWRHANAALEKEIHERRELELDLRTSEANYREQAELLDLTHDAISVRNLDNKIHYWNRAAEFLYGWRKEEVRGKTTHGLFQTRFPKPLPEIDAELFEKGSWEGELIHTRHDGSVITVSSRWALRTDTNGRPLSILESNRDITQRKREEEKFRNLLESAPDAFVIVNRTGHIQLVNAQTEKLFGYSRGELIGQPVEILLPQRFQAMHGSHRTKYVQSPRTRDMSAGLELYGRRKDGTEFPVEVSLSPLETAEGTLISSAIRDVTERNANAEALRASEERFRNFAETANDAILSADSKGNIVYFNHAAERVFSYSREEVMGRPITLLMPERFHDAHRKGLARFMSTGEPRVIGKTVEMIGRRKDGAEFPIELSLSSWKSREGTFFTAILSDIAERKHAEDQIKNLNSELSCNVTELALVNRELEAFSYSVAHDLRAPLRHIDGFARIIKDGHAPELSPGALHHLDRILHAANHMGQLVDALLNLARLGRKELARMNTRLDDVVRLALDDLPETAGREIEWRIGPLPEVSCDPGLLKLVFVNLLSNAVKFSRTRQPAVIEVGARLDNGITLFFVRDNGVGFDQKYADKLFGVFQRLHRQEEFEGTGVGLATVQRIIHRHGGEIWAESQPDCGTTFSFTLGSLLPPYSSKNSSEVKLNGVPSR